MFSPKKQQLEICLLKLNLDEIENDVVIQHSTLPTLDAEIESKYHETLSALKHLRSINIETERLKQENVRLTAKRMQLKRQCEDISRELERARCNRSEVENLLKQEESDMEEEIGKYEEFLQEKTDWFRKTRVFHNENQIKAQIESLGKLNKEFKSEEERKQNDLNELQREFDQMQAQVPENLLVIIGKNNLNEKLKAQSLKYDALCEKRDNLLNSRRNVTGLPTEY